MEIKPLGNRMLVKRVDTRDVTSGGIIIPESAKEKANVGLVMAVGPGKITDSFYEPRYSFEDPIIKRQEVLVKAGQKVLFGKYSGVDFEHQGDTLLFLREDEILAILD